MNIYHLAALEMLLISCVAMSPLLRCVVRYAHCSFLLHTKSPEIVREFPHSADFNSAGLKEGSALPSPLAVGICQQLAAWQ